MGARKHRDWPSGIRNCSKYGQPFKQLASLAAHTRSCTGKSVAKREHPRYPKHFQDYLNHCATAEAARTIAQKPWQTPLNCCPMWCGNFH